jgi:outer membrane protein OmpA-like peptidoglycan-associated protein/tetratricopeptide (TPR) repeat protein
MKKLFFLLTVLALTVNAVYAQKLKKAYDQLHAGEYEDAESMFNKAISKNMESGVAYFALATIRFDTASGRKNNQKAYDLFQKAKDKLAKIAPKTLDVYKATYGSVINAAACDSMMRLCVMQDFYTIYKNFNNYICSSQDTLLQKFLAKYGKKYPKLKEQLTFSIDSLDFQIARYLAKQWILESQQLEKNKCIKCFNEIFADPRPHPFHDSVMQAMHAIQQEMYDNFVQDGNYFGMFYFRLQYDPSFEKEERNLYNMFFYSNTYPFEAQPKDTLLMWEIMTFDEDTSSTKLAEPNLKKYVEKFAPTEYGFLLLKMLTSSYLEKKNWDAAINIYLKYRDLYPQRSKDIDKIIGLLSEPNPPQFVDEQRLPDQVNSPIYLNDYAPVITPNMKKLYFVRDMDMRHSHQEDMFVSEFKDGQWTEAKPIERFATLNNNESTEHIYPDENMMVMFLNGKFWVSEKQENGTWGAPYLFESKTDKYGEGGVNGGGWQADAYFSADGQAMLFATQRKTIDTVGIGALTETNFNIDIYVSLKDEDGMWGMPFSIGNTINSPYVDRSPRLSPDLKTLFFTSNGHYGLGGYDIFMSRRLSDTSWTEWSEPVNLGRIINSVYNEAFFFNAYDGKTIFYSKSNSNVNNNEEIYTAKLPEKFRAETTSLLSGIVTSSDGTPVHSTIVWEDLNTGTHLGNLKNDPITGEFSITLPLGRQYEYFIEADGYVPQSGIFDTRNTSDTQVMKDSIVLYTINEMIDGGLSVVIKNIFFDFDKYDLKPESMGEIRHLAKFLIANPDLTVQIAGYTDNVGAEQHNQQLSEKRANTVRDALVNLGVAPHKIKAQGYGSTKPISNNDAENRRVEFSILN